MRHRRRALGLMAAASLLAALAACSSSSSSGSSGSSGGSQASGKVTDVAFGYSNANINNWASAQLAYDPGYCAKYGVKVSAQILNTTAYTPAIDTDQVNFVFASGNILTAMAKGVVHNEKVIASLGLNAPAGVYGIWATPQITSVSQLKGKTFAASSATSPSHLGAVALIKHAGISDSQANFTYVGSNSALDAALAHGTVSAAWNNGPLPAANAQAKDHIVLPLSTDPSLEVINGYYMVGNANFMKAHPAATKGVLECLAAATKAGRSDNPAVLSQEQANLAKHVGNLAFAKEAWPEYPVSAAVMPMDAANVTNLQKSLSIQLGKDVPTATVQQMVDTSRMQGVTAVPMVNANGTSKYPFYSGK